MSGLVKQMCCEWNRFCSSVMGGLLLGCVGEGFV